MKKKDDNIKLKLWIAGMPVLAILLFFALFVALFHMAWPSISQYGLQFLSGTDWNANGDVFGALPFVVGTLTTSLLALLMAAPIAIVMSIFVSEIAPERFKKILRVFVELLAGIPSIVVGLWGIFVLIPILRDVIFPLVDQYLSFLPFLRGPSFGIGVLAASVVLATMILPTIASVCCEIFATVPAGTKEAALALGATRFEMIKLAVLRPSTSGIISAIILGLARAIGETMAVAMVIGNTPKLFSSLWEPGATLASMIANDYAEASSVMHISSLGYLALILMMISFLINQIARNVQRQITAQGSDDQ